MTEEGWLKDSDLDSMLHMVLGKSARKDRLFTAAACRRWINNKEMHWSGYVGHFATTLQDLADDRIAPEHLTGQINNLADCIDGCESFLASYHNPLNAHHGDYGVSDLARRARQVLLLQQSAFENRGEIGRAILRVVRHGVPDSRQPYLVGICHLLPIGLDKKWVSGLVHEVFENPFRPVSFDPSWLTPNVLALARIIYEECAFDIMPILGESLEHAGCDSDDLLSHLRSSELHVRGCWVIDLLLGKN